MKHAHAIVINENGYKVEFVLVNITEDDIIHSVNNYHLKDGESLIFEDVPTALSLHKPRWTHNTWQETATDEELDAAYPVTEELSSINEIERLAVEMTEAIASQQDMFYAAITEFTQLIAGGI